MAPLLEAGLVIQLHAFAAFVALGLGLVQFALPKGRLPHRLFGYGWVSMMMIVAASSLFIHTIQLWGIWSPIHLLSLLVLVSVPNTVLAARRGNIAAHKRGMIQLFALAPVVTGLFTFLPGRIMHAVVFGG